MIRSTGFVGAWMFAVVVCLLGVGLCGWTCAHGSLDLILMEDSVEFHDDDHPASLMEEIEEGVLWCALLVLMSRQRKLSIRTQFDTGVGILKGVTKGLSKPSQKTSVSSKSGSRVRPQKSKAPARASGCIALFPVVFRRHVTSVPLIL